MDHGLLNYSHRMETGEGTIEIVDSFDRIDGRKLMDLYAESNKENAEFFYPGLQDKSEALEKTEADYLNYLKNEFFSVAGNLYVIYEADGIWLSALRLYRIKDGFYYLEALETHPDHRRKGYGSCLLDGLLNVLKEQGPFQICDCVGKQNHASLSVHKKCGFRIVSDTGYDYLANETDDRCYGLRYTYER